MAPVIILLAVFVGALIGVILMAMLLLYLDVKEGKI